MSDTVDLMLRARFDAVANTSDDRDWNAVLARVQRNRGCGRPEVRGMGSRRTRCYWESQAVRVMLWGP